MLRLISTLFASKVGDWLCTLTFVACSHLDPTPRPPKSSRKRARTRCGPCFNCVPWRAKKKCPQQPGGGPTGKGGSGVFMLPYLGVHAAEAQAVTTGLARLRLSAASMESRRRAQDVKVLWRFHSLTVLLLCNTNDCRCRVMSLAASSYLPASAYQAPPRPQEARCGQTASQRHDRRGAIRSRCLSLM